MMPIWHILLGLFASLILFFSGIDLLLISIFFFSCWLIIDLDHVFYYMFKTKQINPLKFWTDSLEKKPLRKDKDVKKPIWVFHSLECLSFLLIFSFFSEFILFLLLGFIFHLIFDWIEIIYKKQEFYYKMSLIYTMVKNKNKQELF